MASELKRETIVILRMDGEDLLEFINSASYEPDMISIFDQLNISDGSILDCVTKALHKLTVDHGMPPLSDPWVVSNIVEPALQSVVKDEGEGPLTREILLEEFKKFAMILAKNLKEEPVIVAHSEQTFDGSEIRRLLSNEFELNKMLEGALKDLPTAENGKMVKERVTVAMDLIGASAGLPPSGVVHQIDNTMTKLINILESGDEKKKTIEPEDFKKLIKDILESIILQLEENPITISSNSVLREPFTTSN